MGKRFDCGVACFSLDNEVAGQDLTPAGRRLMLFSEGAGERRAFRLLSFFLGGVARLESDLENQIRNAALGAKAAGNGWHASSRSRRGT